MCSNCLEVLIYLKPSRNIEIGNTQTLHGSFLTSVSTTSLMVHPRDIHPLSRAPLEGSTLYFPLTFCSLRQKSLAVLEADGVAGNAFAELRRTRSRVD